MYLGMASRNLPEVLSVFHESACSPSVASLQNGQQDVDHCVGINSVHGNDAI